MSKDIAKIDAAKNEKMKILQLQRYILLQRYRNSPFSFPFGDIVVSNLIESVQVLIENLSSSEINAQKQAAIDIIRAGKDNGADSVKITMSEKNGLNLNSNKEGLPAGFSAGKSNNMTIEIKYK